MSDTIEKLDEYSGKAKKATDSINAAADAISRLSNLGSRSQGKVGGMTTAFDDLAKSAINVTSAIGGTAEASAKLLSMRGLEDVFATLGSGANILKFSMKSLVGVSKDVAETTFNLFDAPSRDIRRFASEVFTLNKRFGGTIDQAFEFSDTLKEETFSQFSRGLNLTFDEMMTFARATGNSNMSLDQLNKTVETGIGKTNLLTAAMALSKATSLTTTEGVNLLNIALNKQGKGAQDAIDMMGLFSGVSKETGLSVDSVSSTLNGAADRFTKLGISADFGVPLLQGFARVMTDMGLGIENAKDLTSSLSGALVDLTTNYANAYIMFQRGGLEMSGSAGGGALGASIGLQAEVLKADRTGDQSELATQLAKGMRDTLASFTGGEIVTVEQAAESPELQTQFYTQQQLLQNQFGVSDAASANRVLDLLSKIDEATKAGDLTAKSSLEKQLTQEKEGRDKTLDEWEKANRHLAAQSNLLAIIARPIFMNQRDGGRALRENVLDPAVAKAKESAEAGLNAYGKLMKRLLGAAGIGADDDLPDLDESPSHPQNTDLPEKDRGKNPNADSLSKNTDMVVMAAEAAAAAASTAAINEAGFVNKDDFVTALAAAITQSLNDNLSINVSLSEGTKGHLEVAASLGKQVSR